MERLIEEVASAYELTDWSNLVPALQEELAVVASEGVSIAFRAPAVAIRGEISGAFSRVNEAALEYAEGRAAEMVGMKWVDGELVANPDARYAITESTRDWLRDSVADAFEQGEAPAQLAKRIESSKAFAPSRAKMIAHTEVGNANVSSQMEVSIAAGATHKRTSLSANHADDDDDICMDAADAGEVPIDHDYGGGLKAPLFHPRCECAISTYVRKKK